MVERREVFGLPVSQNVQEWREYLVGMARISKEARKNVEMSDEEWNRQWDLMMNDGMCEVEVADMTRSQFQRLWLREDEHFK